MVTNIWKPKIMFIANNSGMRSVKLNRRRRRTRTSIEIHRIGFAENGTLDVESMKRRKIIENDEKLIL